jgi:hypothetical protein
MSFETTLKKIDSRTWSNVKSKWFNYLPIFDYPGQAPNAELYEAYDLANYQKEVKGTPDQTMRSEVEVLRSDIFREGIYHLHKANHICYASNLHIEGGLPTWSISGAYQASLFGIKAVLNLLGIALPKVNMNHLLIDCFPKDAGLSNKQKKLGFIPSPELKFIYLPPLTHKQHWEVFQRVLRVTEIDIWDANNISFLTGITSEQFTKLRNGLHYKCSYWTYPDDLFKPKEIASFGLRSGMLNNKSLTGNEDDLNILICYMILKLSYDILEEFSKLSTSIKDEYELMKVSTITPNIRLNESLYM